jgi:hypothetical protein
VVSPLWCVCKNVYIDDYIGVYTPRTTRLNRREADTLPGTTVRIRQETHDTLQDLREQTGEAMPDLVARAVEQFYRSLLIAETNRGYAELRASGDQLDELEVLDGSLADGLD